MKKIIFCLVSILALSTFANDVTVKGVDLKNSSATESRLSIKLDGNFNETPVVEIKDNTISVSIPNSRVKTKLERKILESNITASQIDRSTVGVKVKLPFSLKGKEAQVATTLKEGAIEITLPKALVAAISRSPAVDSAPEIAKAEILKKEENKEAEKLDEKFLANLEKEGQKMNEEMNSDRVKLTQASLQKEVAPVEKGTTSQQKTDNTIPKSSFSISTYVGKFVAFLGIMLLGFYGVLTLMKKGVIKKGKLGFLNSTKLVEVLSTTHVAPKRSLMMIKAHKQVFLVSNTEAGMQLISEINDVAGLIKTGEAEITGSNFDTNLREENRAPKEFRLKEDTVADDYTLEDMLNETPVKDQIRFSDQVKSKVKGLKHL